MVLLSKNQEKNILDEVVITRFEILPNLLKVIDLDPHILQNKLRKESNMSGGKVYHSVKALKAMKLAINGNGLVITPLGKKFLNGYLLKNKIPEDVLKEACLNVTLFNKLYNDHINEKDPKKLFKILKTKINEDYTNINERLIGSSIRRYLQGIYNIKLRAGAKTGSIRQKQQNNLDGTNNLEPCFSSINEEQLIKAINTFNEIKKLPLEKSIKKFGKNLTQAVLNYL